EYAASKGVSTPFICLKDYSQNTPRQTDSLGLCGTMSARTNRSAAAIIYDVSRACGVSAKVLLVLLQKEQSLVTDDWPWPIQYQKATGFACPDTAACNPDFAGFFYQVYYGARQYKKYKTFPENYNYRAGFKSYVQWHPNAGCGGTSFTIDNHATAGLYNYTPYRPNSTALNNLYGTGNGCSSYGNRNFWRMYSDWFGSTLTNSAPDKAVSGDWDGDGKNEIGLQRFDEFLLNYNNNGLADASFIYGVPSDKPISGNWNGDSKDTIGVKRGNVYYLNNGFDLHPEVTFSYGRSTDTPLTGDWNKTGKDKIGVKRGKTFYLNYNNDGVADKTFTYGRDTDTALSGDWNGDGKDTIAIKRGKFYYFDYDNDGVTDLSFSYGR
ncbi:MAG: hypothetical protein ACR2FM_03785, partial [Candidatus Saccharimonadales bacterium]